jgi:hydrogenase expression/formation protein HypD
MEAQKMNQYNFMVLSAHKIMPPAMASIIQTGLPINGYLAPGHVCTITGADIFRFIPDQYHIPVVVAGFEPLDILHSILLLVRQVENKEANLEIQYQRVVNNAGNNIAKKAMENVFKLTDAWWRGLGVLPQSGLAIQQEYKVHDAKAQLSIVIPQATESTDCICGDILKGLKIPTNCTLFRLVCTPDNPVGACMVSNEGTCQAYFRYMNTDL